MSDWRTEQRQREAVLRLDDRLLADIGIAREREIARSLMMFCEAVAPESPNDT